MQNQHADYLSLVALGQQNGFRVTCPWDATYQADMRIWNLRLQTGPAMIAYCMNTGDVQVCVKWCSENNFRFRVRSGGHHHEGMSCDYGVLIIDLTGMQTIEYVDSRYEQAWIPPGKQLQYVYKELGQFGKVIPGGGCETVCTGGLTLGGGWGMSARMYGLTCDSLLEVEIVMADGSVLTANETNEHKQLFWALRGGGSGSFGIITRMLFRLSPATVYTSFTLEWRAPAAVQGIMAGWLADVAADAMPDALTIACRLYHDPSGNTFFSMSGRIYGTEEEAKAYTNRFKPIATPYSESYTPYPPAAAEENGAAASALAQKNHFAETKLHTSAPADMVRPPDTCATGPYPHKVSSAFAKNEAITRLAEVVYQFMLQNGTDFPRANTYLSFHSFGGAISEKPAGYTAFPWRDRKLLLQFQAWWSDPNDPYTSKYIQWIEDFRKLLAGLDLTDGGFFNFQDASIHDDKYELIKYYLGNHLDELIRIKKIYDPTNVFDFPMSIPAAQ